MWGPTDDCQWVVFFSSPYPNSSSLYSVQRNIQSLFPGIQDKSARLFLSPSCGKNLPKYESLASVLAYVLWFPPCRYWITEFWIMFKMDTSLASTMEEFQELVKANGEELHCRLIDTTQMWVSYLSKPPPSCDITQAAQQGSVSCCDPRRLQAGSVALPKRKACQVPGKQRSPWW